MLRTSSTLSHKRTPWSVSIAWFLTPHKLIKLLLHSRWDAVHLFNSIHHKEPWRHGFYKGGINGRSETGLKFGQLRAWPTPVWAYFDDLLMCSNNQSPLLWKLSIRLIANKLDWMGALCWTTVALLDDDLVRAGWADSSMPGIHVFHVEWGFVLHLAASCAVPFSTDNTGGAGEGCARVRPWSGTSGLHGKGGIVRKSTTC